MSNLTFNNTALSVISQNNQSWLTSASLAQALEYKDAKSIQRIFTRNADEFTHSMTSVVKLTTQAGKRETRIFSLRGCHLIAMFSRTKVAKEFRKWVLDVLDKEAEQTQPDRSRFITEEQVGHIYQVVMSLCRNSGLTYQKVFGELKHHFGVNSYKNILKADYPAACRLLGVQPKEKLSMVAHNKAVRELSDYAITHLEANAVWRGVAAHRWGELELLANQLEKLAKKINHLKANLHDPILEQNFHFMNFDNEEIRRRVDLYIEMQNSYRS